MVVDWVTLTLVLLGAFAAGHMIGFHQGWMDGYWTEHPIDEEPSDE